MNMKGKADKRKEYEAKWLGEPTEEWLKSYNKKDVITNAKRNIALFCDWIGKSDVQLVQEYKEATDKEQWAKEMGDKLVEWLNSLLQADLKVNTARSYVSSIRAFFTNKCRTVKIKRGKFPKQQAATGEHEFSQTEMQKMFHYTDVRGKAILSTAVSLGWAADDFLNLERNEIEGFVNKVLAEKEQFPNGFIGFTHVRGKTGATTRAHLTPEAIESLRAYLDITPKDAKFLWANGALNDHITDDTLNNILRDMTAKAGIVTIGTVHFHLIRKFTMSTLSDTGCNEWETKFMVGKEIPVDIATYLINRKQNLMEKFQMAYPKLSLTGYANRNHTKIEELEAQNQAMQIKLEQQTIELEVIKQILESALPKEQLIAALLKTAQTVPRMTPEKLEQIKNLLVLIKSEKETEVHLKNFMPFFRCTSEKKEDNQ